MSYYVKVDGDTFDIVEKETSVVIDLKTTERRARDLCRKMNLGAGFNGNIPEFFANFRGKEVAS